MAVCDTPAATATSAVASSRRQAIRGDVEEGVFKVGS